MNFLYFCMLYDPFTVRIAFLFIYARVARTSIDQASSSWSEARQPEVKTLMYMFTFMFTFTIKFTYYVSFLGIRFHRLRIKIRICITLICTFMFKLTLTFTFTLTCTFMFTFLLTFTLARIFKLDANHLSARRFRREYG